MFVSNKININIKMKVIFGRVKRLKSSGKIKAKMTQSTKNFLSRTILKYHSHTNLNASP
jgi:hypothetical protein